MTHEEATIIWRGLSQAQRATIRQAAEIRLGYLGAEHEAGYVRPLWLHGKTADILREKGLIAQRLCANDPDERKALVEQQDAKVAEAKMLMNVIPPNWKTASVLLKDAGGIEAALGAKALFLTETGWDLYDNVTDDMLRACYAKEYGDSQWRGRYMRKELATT